MLEYALKKERLLLEINKTIDKQTLIYLIATGLPNFVMDRIDRESLIEVNDLLNYIRGLESLTRKNDTKRNSGTGNKYNKQEIQQTEKGHVQFARTRDNLIDFIQRMYAGTNKKKEQPKTNILIRTQY